MYPYHKSIEISDIFLDPENRRIEAASSQPETIQRIIKEQGDKLVVLARDIIDRGVSPFDIPMLIEDKIEKGKYVVIEGNRRIAALKLIKNPELAAETALYKKFQKLNKEGGESVLNKILSVVVKDRESGKPWIKRKHSNGMNGAGTEHWSAIAKARDDVADGIPRPDLALAEYVEQLDDIDAETKEKLSDSDYSITTLERIVRSKTAQDTVGFFLKDGKIIATQAEERVSKIFLDIVRSVATKKAPDGSKFTERSIDSEKELGDFVKGIAKNKPPKDDTKKTEWEVSGNPTKPKQKAKSTPKKRIQERPDTTNRKALIPSDFKLKLPSGRINDIFKELKKLEVKESRNAVAALFRVFVEFSLDEYISSKQIPNAGESQQLKKRMEAAKNYITQNNLMDKHQIKPLNTLISNDDDLLSDRTLHSYLHNKKLDPDPLQLKISWNNIQPFILFFWKS